MIQVFKLPEDKSALDDALESNELKHVWHDVPNNRYLIYTGEDLPSDQ